MGKIKVGIIFGGKSGEHEVSLVSAISVYHALDKSKYDVALIGIDKRGRWLLPKDSEVLAHRDHPERIALNQAKGAVSLVPYQSEKQLIPVEAEAPSMSALDVVFPVLHGTYGEDGTVQGLLELAGIPYVGSGVLGSALGMDKEMSKRLFQMAGLPVVPALVFKKHEFTRDADACVRRAIDSLGLPFFVKPVNMGSSVGVHKVKTEAEARALIGDAFRYDLKVLCEKAINGRELECGVLGNDEPKASVVGEIVPRHEFYSYEAKYVDEAGADLHIPATGVSPDLVERIQRLSIDAFKALECRGLARVDFFLDRQSGELYLNEINTIPGFTKISMYPKLWEASGVSYAELLDRLLQLAIEHHREKSGLETSFEIKKP